MQHGHSKCELCVYFGSIGMQWKTFVILHIVHKFIKIELLGICRRFIHSAIHCHNDLDYFINIIVDFIILHILHLHIFHFY